MKSYKDVEKARRLYHQDKAINSIHRSSLMLPEIQGSVVELSFLNHFLLKRGYEKVACRITAIDQEGKRIESRFHELTEPRVYTFRLTGMVQQPVSQYMVEFFCANNLFIPFAGAMVNHVGPRHLNQVHAYNRVLNDVFEDDEINKIHVREASIDLIWNDDTDTFFLFSSGPTHCRGRLEATIVNESARHEAVYELDLPRFGTKRVTVAEIFKGLPKGTSGVLTVRQPQQPLFYGRLFAGQSKLDHAFSANHTYYDSSTVEEYWDNDAPANRLYPFFAELNNRVRFYPIVSPSKLNVSIALHSANGHALHRAKVGELQTPGSRYLDIDVSKLVRKVGLKDSEVSAFFVEASDPGGKIPTRVVHQLVYGDGGMEASIAMSLWNSNVFIPPKKGFTWAQSVAGRNYDSRLGIVADPVYEKTAGPAQSFKLDFYSERGFILSKEYNIKSGGAVLLDLRGELGKLLPEEMSDENPHYIWATVSSERPGLSLFTVVTHRESRHSSGEHGF